MSLYDFCFYPNVVLKEYVTLTAREIAAFFFIVRVVHDRLVEKVQANPDEKMNSISTIQTLREIIEKINILYEHFDRYMNDKAYGDNIVAFLTIPHKKIPGIRTKKIIFDLSQFLTIMRVVNACEFPEAICLMEKLRSIFNYHVDITYIVEYSRRPVLTLRILGKAKIKEFNKNPQLLYAILDTKEYGDILRYMD